MQGKRNFATKFFILLASVRHNVVGFLNHCGVSDCHYNTKFFKNRSGQSYHHVLFASETKTIEPYALPQNLKRLIDRLHRISDVKEKSMFIVELGDIFSEKHRNVIPLHLLKFSNEVRGCTAKVQIAVKVHTSDSNYAVELGGISDSRLVHGIIGLLIEGLSGETTNTLLQLDGRRIADEIGINVGMSSNRIIGIRNIVTVIQNQIREQMNAIVPKSKDIDTKNAIQGSTWPYSSDEIALLLSGGVDSSVALRLLLQQGHKVRAFYIKIWLEDEIAHLGECPWEEDLKYAQAVCDQVSVPLETVSLQREYWDLVVGYTLAEARAGRTPNPDIMCNNRIKFGMFFEYVGKHFKHVATGHYAAVMHNDNATRLFQSADDFKDQTYFLCGLSQKQLKKALFPVGGLTKEQVRKEAQQFDLPTKIRPDSQGICFLGKLKFDDFLRAHLGESPGPCIELESGDMIGRHNGLWFHTIGQRRGIGPILNPQVVHRGPWFVAGKDMLTNTLYVTTNYDCISDERTEFRVRDLHFINSELSKTLFENGIAELMVKTRHGPNIQRCIVQVEDFDREILEGSSATCRLLDGKDSGLAPGQFAAFYVSRECLGSGVIA